MSFRSAAFVSLSALSLFVAPSISLANDTSFPSIEVDGIQTNAKRGTNMSFSGGEASKVMALLPPVNSVLGPIYDGRRRALVISSPGYSIQLHCTDLPLDLSSGDLSTATARCDIHFDVRNEDIGTFPFEPKSQCAAE